MGLGSSSLTGSTAACVYLKKLQSNEAVAEYTIDLPRFLPADHSPNKNLNNQELPTLEPRTLPNHPQNRFWAFPPNPS